MENHDNVKLLLSYNKKMQKNITKNKILAIDKMFLLIKAIID